MKVFGEKDLGGLYRPAVDSHKGMNGRVLVIGGSKLFHASIFWSGDVASKVVDLVHFTSPAEENNDLVRRRVKQGFWNGIVVDWSRVESYVEEDDCVLIGPGMSRDEGLMDGEEPTGEIVNRLLREFPNKRWVIDGGALQEVDCRCLNENMIVTPHCGEFVRLLAQLPSSELRIEEYREKVKSLQQFNGDGDMEELVALVRNVSERLRGVTVLLKGVKDLVYRSDVTQMGHEGDEWLVVEGGNEGLTKGGSGDVLAGLAAAFYAKNDPVLSAAAASLVVKRAAQRLYHSVGPYYNSSDLVDEVPGVLWGMVDALEG